MQRASSVFCLSSFLGKHGKSEKDRGGCGGEGAGVARRCLIAPSSAPALSKVAAGSVKSSTSNGPCQLFKRAKEL